MDKPIKKLLLQGFLFVPLLSLEAPWLYLIFQRRISRWRASNTWIASNRGWGEKDFQWGKDK